MLRTGQVITSWVRRCSGTAADVTERVCRWSGSAADERVCRWSGSAADPKAGLPLQLLNEIVRIRIEAGLPLQIDSNPDNFD